MTEAIAYEVNVTTGEVIERERTAEELAAEASEQAEQHAKRAEAEAIEQTAAAKKAAILAALADATGYTADELREALNA